MVGHLTVSVWPGFVKFSNHSRFLLLDGHGSHADVEFMWTCYQNKIACLYLLAHTSHILQPLDLAPFSEVKSKV